jgi:hypothetical protein
LEYLVLARAVLVSVQHQARLVQQVIQEVVAIPHYMVLVAAAAQLVQLVQ